MHGTSSPSKLLNLSNFGGCTWNRGKLGVAWRYALGATDKYKFLCSSCSGCALPTSNTLEKSIKARKPFMRNELNCTTSSFGLLFRTFVAYATGEPSQSRMRTSNTTRDRALTLAPAPESGIVYMICQPSTLARKKSAAGVTRRLLVSHGIARIGCRSGRPGGVIRMTVPVRVSYATTLEKSPNAFVITYSICACAGSWENLAALNNVSSAFSVTPERLTSSGIL